MRERPIMAARRPERVVRMCETRYAAALSSLQIFIARTARDVGTYQAILDAARDRERRASENFSIVSKLGEALQPPNDPVRVQIAWTKRFLERSMRGIGLPTE